MFSGCPSVTASVRGSVCPDVHPFSMITAEQDEGY